jgi:hypothetical protein
MMVSYVSVDPAWAHDLHMQSVAEIRAEIGPAKAA